MGEDQELRHVCKFCYKSFPCGRSLGGHMRSHMINSTDGRSSKKMLPSLISNVNLDKGTEAAGDQSGTINYGLRENPKKTSKFAESSEDTLLPNQNKVCKECGKSFQSWKALFGHMKCHSERISSMNNNNNNSVEEDSWNSANHKQELMDSQSDTEAAAPNKKKRSSRKMKRYMPANTTSSSLTVNASPCVSDIEHELQEEVAMSLILLSKDVGNWVSQNHVTECSDNNYQSHKIGIKSTKCKDGDLVNMKKVKIGKSEQGGSSKSNSKMFGMSSNGKKRDNSEVPNDEKKKKINVDNENRVVEESEVEFPNKLVKGSGLVMSQMSFDLQESSSKMKFECTTCNKSFHSYQALGGHRASHKNSKGENSNNDLEHLQNQDTDHVKNCSNESGVNEIGEKNIETSYGSKKLSKMHECPICFKIFPSGQALGGHKRSHLIAEAKRNNNQAVEIQKPMPEIRNFLDLNLPAPIEEENMLDSSSEHVGFQQWWMENSHKHEQLLGLLSN